MESRPSSRRKKNSPKVNLTFSLIFHGAIIFCAFFFAAREGVLGNKLKEITVAIVPKEKPPPEPEKPPPPPPPKEETPKEEPKEVEQPKEVVAPPPVQDSRPVANESSAASAPAAVIPADFAFGDGAKPVEVGTGGPGSSSYKGFLEYSLRSNWEPPDTDNTNFIAEVEISVDATGRITGYDWKKGSGNKPWDDSVKKALAATHSLDRPPPKGFPGKALVRFDMLPATEPAIQ